MIHLTFAPISFLELVWWLVSRTCSAVVCLEKEKTRNTWSVALMTITLSCVISAIFVYTFPAFVFFTHWKKRPTFLGYVNFSKTIKVWGRNEYRVVNCGRYAVLQMYTKMNCLLGEGGVGNHTC